jgi:hypothetical protein
MENPLVLEREILEVAENDRISCFDLNDKYIAIGFSKDRIDFYDINDLEYSFSFVFDIAGGYSFRLYGDELHIVDIRKNVIASYEYSGAFQSYIYDIDPYDFFRENEFRNEVALDNATYKINKKGNVFMIVQEDNEKSTIIYSIKDRSLYTFWKMIGIIILAFLIASLTGLFSYFISKRIRSKRKG